MEIYYADKSFSKVWLNELIPHILHSYSPFMKIKENLEYNLCAILYALSVETQCLKSAFFNHYSEVDYHNFPVIQRFKCSSAH